MWDIHFFNTEEELRKKGFTTDLEWMEEHRKEEKKRITLGKFKMGSEFEEIKANAL